MATSTFEAMDKIQGKGLFSTRIRQRTLGCKSPVARGKAHSAQSGAFTLVELLVVIGIIALLVGILIPVISSVRMHAYSVATTNEVQQISAAIDGYYMDCRSYPGPLPDADLLDSSTSSGTPPLLITASQNMIMGLLGGINQNGNTYTFLASDVGHGPMTFGTNGNGYYTTRHSPCGQNLTQFLPSSAWNNPFQIPGLVSDVKGLYPPDFVDRIPARKTISGPILYLRANAGVRPANSPAQQGSAAITTTDDVPSAQYDNKQLQAYASPSGYPELGGATPPVNPSTGRHDYATWDAYFQDQSYLGSKPATGWAYTPGAPASHLDAYLLISAGPDGVFGTADDIRN